MTTAPDARCGAVRRWGTALALCGALGAGRIALAATLEAAGPVASSLSVPLLRQARERCGPAALEMVLRFYGASESVVHEGERAYDPVLRGSLITDLAAAARRAGFDAEVATLTPDALMAELADGVPPIVLYQSGRAPLTVPHFGVVTGWQPERGVFTLNVGTLTPRVMSRDEFARRWRTAGSQALLVRRRTAP
jgi:ABC-type bacteriocin/lantibiotic exporter with double-glycine peptidase domain